tara:strand:+ start:872 stop:1510 length:639 start_codon:yes stop_codon:yes gene_type:complete
MGLKMYNFISEMDGLQRLGFEAPDPLQKLGFKAPELKVVEDYKGSDGSDGYDGRDGVDGRDGLDGRDGTIGLDGTKGLDGREGVDGRDGVDGVDGVEGERGPMPRHQIKDDKICFEESEGVWGPWISFNTINQISTGSAVARQETKWVEYAAGFSATPTLTQTISTGQVYTYTYSNGTLYRLVPSGSEPDAFYKKFIDGVLSGLVAKKQISI